MASGKSRAWAMSTGAAGLAAPPADVEVPGEGTGVASGAPPRRAGVDGVARAADGARPRATLVQWAERTAHVDDAELARLLAGLDDAELTALAAEFEARPQLPRPGWVHAMPVLAAVLLAGAALAGWAYNDSGDARLAVLLVLALLGAAGAGAVVAIDGLRRAPTWRNHRRLGLYVSVLDEFHPWLVETHLRRQHAAAEEYRRQVVGQRGALRGVDAVMMKSLVRAADALEATRPAAALARELQRP